MTGILKKKTSKKGNKYKALIPSIKISVNGCLMTVTRTIPLFWNADGDLYNFSATFGLLPDINEEFEIEKLIGQSALITIEENEFDGKVYSNVTDIARFDGTLPRELQDWKKQRLDLTSNTNSIFDEEYTEDQVVESSTITKEAQEPAPLPGRRRLPVKKNAPSTQESPSTSSEDEDDTDWTL